MDEPGDDEAQIQQVFIESAAAATSGSLERLRPFFADDFVFLLPGEAPIKGVPEFLELMEMMHAESEIVAKTEICETQLMGDYAYCLTWLELTFTPRDGSQSRRRAGHTVSLLRRAPEGGWVIFRNANLVAEL